MILSSYGEAFFDLCLNFYPHKEGTAGRVAFYRSTFALQEALHGIEHGGEEAFESGISAYR
ncbi:hypothetical protein [Planomicrobium sp. YIM 101495]|uniref:hypothetical protein n=1 Tax=Planomicrobium sp. YIM 101495 TaxID=2665160 RepID=UPI0012B99CE4|nr:hypothetical protein [Planomicrobium sp. YIM 101495]MTD31248.1 hypothetical protein [Planomicrobium sp. YIM 101495]